MPAPSFDDVRIPETIMVRSEGGPTYSTVVVVTASGAEQRIMRWNNSRRRWSVSEAPGTLTQVGTLLAFFEARAGRARGFRLKDHRDYQVTTAELMVSLTSTTFQMVKRYTSGAVTRVRNIYAPVNGTVHIWNGAVEVLAGFTVNYATGVVTFSGAPGYTPGWTGEFDVPVRFDTDEMVLESEDLISVWQAVPVIELR